MHILIIFCFISRLRFNSFLFLSFSRRLGLDDLTKNIYHDIFSSQNKLNELCSAQNKVNTLFNVRLQEFVYHVALSESMNLLILLMTIRFQYSFNYLSIFKLIFSRGFSLGRYVRYIDTLKLLPTCLEL